MTFLQITSLLIVLAGGFGAINYLFLKLPAAIGILVVSLLASFGLLGLDLIWPSLEIASTVRGLVLGIDFSEALLEGMLGLLLFAGALHVKLSDLRREWIPVFLMATLGIALSTTIVGFAFSWMTGMPLLLALVFGALISPTDPVAVLGVLREADLPFERGDTWVESQPRAVGSRPRPTDVTTLPYPGFPTDLQAQWMTLMTVADGFSIVTEKIYPDRYMHLPELARMGAKIRRQQETAIVQGAARLSGAAVMASDEPCGPKAR